MRSLDIDLLRTFHTIARLGRFKDAATHLGKSTSAVSVHVQRLEEITGARLFERDNQGAVVSARGQQLLNESVGLLAEHDRVMAALSRAPVGRVRLGIPEEYAGGFLKQCLPLFAMENPGIELEVEVASSASLMAMFEKKRLDTTVAVTARNRDVGTVLAEIQPVWVVGRSMQALSQKTLSVALHAEGCPYREEAISSLRHSGRAWRTVVTSGNSAAIMAAVESGMAIAVAGNARLPDTLTVVPASFDLPSLPTSLVVYRAHCESDVDACLGLALRRYFRAAGGY